MSRPLSATPKATRASVLGAVTLVAAAVLTAGSVQAQSASSTLSSYRTGYGGIGLSGLTTPVSPSLISTSNGAGAQYTISDGVNEAGAVGSVFAAQPSSSQTAGSPTSGGAGQSYTGVGQGAPSNERAPLAVVERSNGTAASAHDATTAAPNDMVLNGKLNLDGGE